MTYKLHLLAGVKTLEQAVAARIIGARHKEVPCDKTGFQNRDRRNVGALPSGRRAPATTRGRRGEALRADASGAVAPGARAGGAASSATAAERKAGRGRD